jgi:hypothetical protein
VDSKVTVVLLASLDVQERTEQKEHQDLQVHLEHLEHPDRKVNLDLRDLLDSEEPLVE